MITHTIQEYVQLLADERFKDVDYTVIKAHVSYLKDITLKQLIIAVDKHKEATPAHKYSRPNLKNVVPYLYKSDDQNEDTPEADNQGHVTFDGDVRRMMRKRQTSVRSMRRGRAQRTTVFDLTGKIDENEVYEERLIFLKLLRSCYYIQIGEWKTTSTFGLDVRFI